MKIRCARAFEAFGAARLRSIVTRICIMSASMRMHRRLRINVSTSVIVWLESDVDGDGYESCLAQMSHRARAPDDRRSSAALGLDVENNVLPRGGEWPRSSCVCKGGGSCGQFCVEECRMTNKALTLQLSSSPLQQLRPPWPCRPSSSSPQLQLHPQPSYPLPKPEQLSSLHRTRL